MLLGWGRSEKQGLGGGLYWLWLLAWVRLSTLVIPLTFSLTFSLTFFTHLFTLPLPLQGLLEKPYDKARSHPAALKRGGYALSSLEALWVVCRMQMLLVRKDFGLVRGRWMQVRKRDQRGS